MADSWRSAYFKQARADYDLFLILEKTENIPLCHRLHYLQMMTEKLAKGFRTPKGGIEYAHTHEAFVPFLRIVKSRPEFIFLRGAMTKNQFDAYIVGLYPLAERIQRLAPDLATGPNPEYPWATQQSIVAPIEFSFPDINLNAKDVRLNKLLTLIGICFEIAKRELESA